MSNNLLVPVWASHLIKRLYIETFSQTCNRRTFYNHKYNVLNHTPDADLINIIYCY